MLACLGVQCPLSLRTLAEETPNLLRSISPPQTYFPFTPGCIHVSQPEMLQGITVPLPWKPHGVGARFQAQVVPLPAGLSSQKGQELLQSSSFYSIHKKKITSSQMYKPASKPQSMHCAQKKPRVGWEGIGLVPKYRISLWGESWGVGGKDPRGGAAPQGCTEAAAAPATDAHGDPARSTWPWGTRGEQSKAEGAGCAPNSLPSPRKSPGATSEPAVGKARATAWPATDLSDPQCQAVPRLGDN